ncbi:MAG: DUF885 family protein, partial [Acidobacteriota bacterium]
MKRLAYLGPWIGLVTLLGCSTQPPSTGKGAAAELHALFDREWEFRLREQPILATSVGRHEYDHLLPSVALEDYERRIETWRGMLGELDAIDRSQLDAADQISADIFRSQLTTFIEDFEYGAYQIPLTVD